mmetsp:Transcript_5039/g.10937  ORF Transcript_5039/g.10937 Transcript_5039/m.10937 type:complete len:134 (-) Transcript_5039:141-542(-)
MVNMVMMLKLLEDEREKLLKEVEVATMRNMNIKKRSQFYLELFFDQRRKEFFILLLVIRWQHTSALFFVLPFPGSHKFDWHHSYWFLSSFFLCFVKRLSLLIPRIQLFFVTQRLFHLRGTSGILLASECKKKI